MAKQLILLPNNLVAQLGSRNPLNSTIWPTSTTGKNMASPPLPDSVIFWGEWREGVLKLYVWKQKKTSTQIPSTIMLEDQDSHSIQK